jgi:shikimate kinase
MRLSIIGMAGSGKSYWSKKLAEVGFRRFCCDDLIAAMLASELSRSDGTVMGLAEWMGFPYESFYRDRESRYLAYEIEILGEILEKLQALGNRSRDNIVIDTTGSVIYTGEGILDGLGRHTTVVHLATPPEVKEQMLKVYVTKPRPVLWRDLFERRPNETNHEALTRCYPELLSTRERLYERYANVTIDYYSRKEEGFGVNEFLETIHKSG